MKQQISFMFVAITGVALFFTSCKKTDTNSTSDATTEIQVQADDQSRFVNETDAVANDANATVENLGGTYAGESPLSPQLPFTCDATAVVDTTSNPRTITLTYSGNNCIGNRTRSGVVVISFAPGFRWVTAGSQYTVTYNNLKITRGNDKKTITINGTKTIKNVSGGKLRNLATRLTPIVHEVTSSTMSITFDNGSQRTWQVARRRTFTYDNGIVISITGISPLGNGIAEWGTNRFNKDFTCAITEPMVIRQSCNFRLVSGQLKHTGVSATSTTTFGLDANGNPVTSCPSGLLFYKIEWTGANGNSNSHIGSY